MTISRLYRDQKLLAKCSLAKIGFFQIQTKAIAIVSLLSHDLKLLAKVFVLQRSLSQLPCDYVATASPAKNACFQFYIVDVTVFQTLRHFPRTNSLQTLFNPNLYFIQTPSFSSKISTKSFQGMCFLHYFHLSFSDYA